MKKLWNLVKREEGLESAEYAVLGALIILAIVVAVSTLGGGISSTFTTVAGHMP